MVDNRVYENKKEPNFWVKGRRETKKFNEISFRKLTEYKTFIFGVLIAAILILPFGLMLWQYITIYGFDIASFGIYLTIIWILMMIFNGISNYFTVRISQSLVKDMDNLQKIEAGYIFLYQVLNPVFGIVSLILIVIGAFYIIGAVR